MAVAKRSSVLLYKGIVRAKELFVALTRKPYEVSEASVEDVGMSLKILGVGSHTEAVEESTVVASALTSPAVTAVTQYIVRNIYILNASGCIGSGNACGVVIFYRPVAVFAKVAYIFHIAHVVGLIGS